MLNGCSVVELRQYTLHDGARERLIDLFEREFIEAEREAYMETCFEDDEIALRMDAGRRILMDRGVSEVGPYQSPMEDGMQHFHEWYRARILV